MDDIISQAREILDKATSSKEVDDVRIKFLGKDGIITRQLKELKHFTEVERKEKAKALNTAKAELSRLINNRKEAIELEEINKRLAGEYVDVTQPTRPEARGTIHPVTQIIEEICTIFAAMGFKIARGPEIEDEEHNFNALNMPSHHPARQMHDTFYIDNKTDFEGNKLLLRTHTSTVQIRHMRENKPPIKIVVPGRVYRCDYDMTHTPMFHQIEGLYITEDATLTNLKWCITETLSAIFEMGKVPLRFRPSYFPFTEPSIEVDIAYKRENGELKIGEGNSWLEVLGCGMVHPNVLRNCGIDPDKYQGFAFGMGMERIAMLKYQIADLRRFFEGDIRWMKHYSFSSLDIPSILRGLTK